MGVFAMMLLIVHVAIAPASLAEDKCAALRAQNAQLVAQLASRDAELFRLRLELAAIRSAEEGSGRVIGTQRHLLETPGADTRTREAEAARACARGRITHSFDPKWYPRAACALNHACRNVCWSHLRIFTCVLCAGTPTPPTSTPTGMAVRGAYWRLGANGKDCNTACAAYGGCIASALSGFPVTPAHMLSVLSSAGLSASDCTIGQVRPLTKTYAPAHRVFAPLDNRLLCAGEYHLAFEPNVVQWLENGVDAELRCAAPQRLECVLLWRCVEGSVGLLTCLHDADGALTLVMRRWCREVLSQRCGPALPMRAR